MNLPVSHRLQDPKATPQALPTPPRMQPPEPPSPEPAPAWLQKAANTLRRLETGRTGDAWDIVEAPVWHAAHPVADALLHQLNANLSAGAFTINVASNTAGHLLVDLPAWAEQQWTARGGPSFDETALLLRSVTPSLPWDDLACYGLARWTELARNARYRLSKPEIAVTAEGMAHVYERHLRWDDLPKSLFLPGTDSKTLLQKALSVPPVRQAGGNFERVVDLGRIIGIDRKDMMPTSVYSVITTPKEKLVTMFPGRP